MGVETELLAFSKVLYQKVKGIHDISLCFLYQPSFHPFPSQCLRVYSPQELAGVSGDAVAVAKGN